MGVGRVGLGDFTKREWDCEKGELRSRPCRPLYVTEFARDLNILPAALLDSDALDWAAE